MGWWFSMLLKIYICKSTTRMTCGIEPKTPTRIPRRNVRSSSAVQMLAKLGWWFSTLPRILSNQASLSSEFGQTSGRRAVLSSTTQRRERSPPGEPVMDDVSLTWHAIRNRKLMMWSQNCFSMGLVSSVCPLRALWNCKTQQ